MFSLPAITRARRPQASGQRGASLLMVLILMLVISMLAVFGVRNVRLLERQTTNEQEYQLARQAAEAALRDAEADLNGPGKACPRSNSNPREGRAASAESDEFSNDCKLGQCGAAPARYAVKWEEASSTKPGAPWWPSAKGGNWGDNADADGKPAFDCSSAKGGVPLGTYTGVAQLARVARQPEYLIELITPPDQASAATPPASAASATASSSWKCPGKTTGDGSDVLAAANEDTGGNPPPRPSCNLFRITARGFGITTNPSVTVAPNPRVEVVLQSYVYTLVNK